jgi:penicillin-insensitive murein endopeptidase
VPPDPTADVLALDGGASTSVGAPGRGKLEGGVALPDVGPGFVHNPKRPHEARFGTVEMVQAIVRAAAIVHESMPGVPLVVNDLALEHGGPIAQHGSHQNGRDADILFYSLDVKGEPSQSVGVPVDPKGMGWDFKDLTIPDDDVRVKLDMKRTWRFMQALFEVAVDDVQRIFIAEHVRSMLLAEAERQRAPAHVVARFADVTCQPGAPHDDHMHVRFWCSPEDIRRGCEDKPPLYPWRKQALAALGIEPVQARAATREEREAVEARTTSATEARKTAERRGPMHAKVRRFLAEREAWRKQPHPGRPYCK